MLPRIGPKFAARMRPQEREVPKFRSRLLHTGPKWRVPWVEFRAHCWTGLVSEELKFFLATGREHVGRL